ncbi:MAG: class I SAM-dependent methyltransferase [Planctomycetota bacterium]
MGDRMAGRSETRVSRVNLREQLGDMDLYLLDQILRGHVDPQASVLDAGCGSGRNLVYFLRQGHDVSASDPDPHALARTRTLATAAGRPADATHFRLEPLEDSTFDTARFDLIICNAVLHFARDLTHFQAQVDQLRRMLRPGGLCFCRTASSIGIETLVVRSSPAVDATANGTGWHRLPDGTDRFLVDLDLLLAETKRIGADLVDPIKTTNVQNLRAMTTWVWRRR